MATGAAMAFGVTVPFFGTGLGSGLWLILIGWFLHKAARASFDQLVVRTLLEGVTVREIMRRRVRVVSPEVPVQIFMRDYVMQSDQDVFPVVEDGLLVGVATARGAMQLPSEQWSHTHVRHIMSQDVPTIVPDEDARDALEVMQSKGLTMVPVVQGRQFQGSVFGQDVFKWLMMHQDDIGSRLAA
jgi:predicted transcriptional regulator